MAAPEPMHVDEVGRPPNKCTACGQIKKGHTCTAIRDVAVRPVLIGHKRERENNAEEDWSELSWPLEDLIAMVDEWSEGSKSSNVV